MNRRIAFLLPDMAHGGAERLTVDLANGFRDRGAEVDLVLARAQGEFLGLIGQGVRIVDLKAPRLRNVPGRLRRYLKAERPAALLAAMWPLTTAAVIAGLGMAYRPRLLLSDHCSLLSQYGASATTLMALRASLRASYRFADGLIAVSVGLAEEIAVLAGLPAGRVTTIYNPIPPPLRSAGTSPWGETGRKKILAVGTLKPQKNQALLLEAFAALDSDGAELAIVGTGPLLAQLEDQAERLGVAGRVRLPGFSATPGDWYAGADLFVLSSDYEGFGNVLVEALHCGLRVVSTDCPHGPGEILGDGRWGRLVAPGDAAALTAAMREALAAPVDQAAQRSRAAEFSVDRAIDAYWRLAFDQAAPDAL